MLSCCFPLLVASGHAVVPVFSVKSCALLQGPSRNEDTTLKSIPEQDVNVR